MASKVTLSNEQQLRDTGAHAANRLASMGKLEVLRITRRQKEGPNELIFQGVPARHGGRARSMRISIAEGSLSMAPSFDPSTERIEVYYPNREHPEVLAMLNAHLNRFCYFWRSAEGRTHAWLVGSPR